MSGKYLWDLSAMYSSPDKIKIDRALINTYLSELLDLKVQAKKNIKEILRLEEKIYRLVEKVYVYASMKKDENSKVDQSQKLDMEIRGLYTKVSSELSFIKPLLLSLEDEEIKAIMDDKDMVNHKISLNKIFRHKDHTLSEKEEYVVSSLSFALSAPSQVYYYLTNSDMTFPRLESSDLELNNTTFVQLQMNNDREVRKESFKKFYEVYNSFSNTIATSYYSNIKAKASLAKLKKFKSVRQMYLFNDDVSLDVYDRLIDSIHKNIKSLHKYYEIKKRVLKLEDQHMYDVYMPIKTDLNKTYSFEEAKKLVIESVKPLGKEYVEIYKTAFENRWIDVLPREGKRSGAYSSGSYDSYPYILLNFNGSLDSVFTLAHEMGHSMHSYYSRKNNTYLDHSYTIFVAEVASTFNEALLLDMLMKRAESDSEKLYLIDFYLNSYKSTVFRQTMFAEFEREVHKIVESGDGITGNDMSQIYLDLNKKYFGEAMISDPEIAYEWMRIPHFYNNFYVYKYATGFSASAILAKRVLSKEKDAVENYLNFLKDGGKHFPIDQLKIAGVDMSKPEVVDEALEIFNDLVDQLDKLTK